MSDVIKLVANDTRPQIMLRLTDEATGNAIDLSAAGTAVVVKFRATGTTTVLDTITCTIVDAVDGKVQFDFSGGELTDLAAGQYEGEIQVTFPSSQVHTVYDLLRFRVRDDF